MFIKTYRNWKKSRDKKILHDLLAEKLHAHGLSEDALTFVNKVARVVNLKLAFIMVFIRSSPSFFELTFILLQNNGINNGVTNDVK